MIAPGMIIFSQKEGNLFSRLIGIFSGSQWSHVSVVFGKLNETMLVGEATNPKVLLSPIDKYINEKYTLEVWQINGVNLATVRTAIKKTMPLVGRYYGYFQLAGYLWMLLWHKVGLYKANPFQDGIVCSEFAYYFLKEIGYKGLGDMLPDDVTPGNIWQAFSNDDNVRLVAYSEAGQSDLIWEHLSGNS